MAILHEAYPVRVLTVGKDGLATQLVARLLGLDESVEVLGEAPSIGTAPIAELRPDVVVYDESGQALDTAHVREYVERVAPGTKVCLLAELADYTVSELLSAVRLLAPMRYGPPASPSPSLVPGEREAFASLSDREIEVVRLVAEGLSNKEISARLALSDKTIKNHISHILAKMNFTARTQVAVCALRAGIV